MIVGGGGLELVTCFGDKFGRPKRAQVTLMDARLTHPWKPLLHGVAAGNLMGHLTGDAIIEGRFARLTYRLLYPLHQRALHGTLPMLLLMLSDFLQHRAHPRMKLH